MNTEDLIRESLAKQADRAPAPGPVLAALHRPPRRRALVLAVAAVVGVLVVAAGVVSLRQRTEPVPPAAPPLPIRYTPDWLPDGYYEQARGYDSDGVGSRTWLPAPVRVDQDARNLSGPWLALVSGPDRGDPERDDVVGGVTGHYYTDEARGSVMFSWTPDQGGTAVTVVVHEVPDRRAVLERVVRSVRPESTTRMPVPLLVDSGPHDVHGTPDDWSVEAFDSRWEGVPYTAKLESRRPLLTGEPAVVRGVRGIVDEHGLAVQLAPDRWLSVRPVSDPIPADRLIAIADAARVDLHPDMSWLGTR
jgi:hypothetical protein